MNTVLTIIVLSITLQFGVQSEGGSTDSQEIIHLHMIVDEQDYAWTIIIPKGVEKGTRGLLFLHGYGECGIDGEKHLGVGLPAAIKKDPERWPFVVIAPQKPVFNSEWEDHEPAVLAMIDRSIKEGYIDADRLAITGLSQGGHGTIYFASHHPELFTAAAPVCGYVERRISKEQTRLSDNGAQEDDPAVVEAAKSLAQLPVWLFHGGSDSVVPVSESRSLRGALETIKGDVRYTEVPNTDHNVWDTAYGDSGLAQWLISHTN